MAADVMAGMEGAPDTEAVLGAVAGSPAATGEATGAHAEKSVAPDEFIVLARAYADEVWLERPQDIDRLLKKNLDIDKNLATCCFAFGTTSDVKDEAWRWYRWGKEGKGDLRTLAALASEFLRGQAQTFEVYFGFTDAASLLLSAASAMGSVTSHDELKRVSYELNHCMMLLHYWCDICIPWAELSLVHADLVRAREGAATPRR